MKLKYSLPKMPLPQPPRRSPLSHSTTTPLLPPSSWDSHMHIVDPPTYPLSPTALYTPQPHLLPSYLSFTSTLSNPPPKPVLIQPSIYGTDNSCLLSALHTLNGPRGGARGVVCFDPATTSAETLEGWHALGVRGVRVNLVSVGREVGGEELRGEVGGYVQKVGGLGRGNGNGKGRGWVVQLYVDMSVLDGLVGVDLGDDTGGVRICLDHFGKPTLPPLSATDTDTFDPYSLPGFSTLVTMLRGGRTYVKFSAPYRISDDPEFRLLGVIARELIRVAPGRVVFATDWPHTRFEGVDVGPFVRKCVEWCDGDEGMVERLFRRNAEELWDVDVGE
ncbi:hypothetical protein FQN50_000190 [Emmonsiellopsis sp. PD_5]|nr:hypothetical protein FQN50_000190 [Emmonsiellopsis sp. PD_5]